MAYNGSKWKQLLEENQQLKKMVGQLQAMLSEKRYGLMWEQEAGAENLLTNTIGLKEVQEKSIHTSEDLPVNWLIEGDNYESLQLLLKTYAEQVNVIYIDPPYNTGKHGFNYRDYFKPGKSSYKHSTWLGFMHKRLCLAKELLHVKGVIFISIDDRELAQTKLLCDEIFGERNFVANFIRKCKSGSGHDSCKIAIEFDYILCYAKDTTQQAFTKEELNVDMDPRYRNSDSFEPYRGKYYLRDLDYKGTYSTTLDYMINAPDGSEIWPGGTVGKPYTWRWSREKLEWGLQNDFIVFKKARKRWKVYIKQYQFVDNTDHTFIRKVPYRALIEFANAKGSSELKNILHQNLFTYPKPIDLLKFLINLVPGRDLTVMDFFAGSGTTGHAVLTLNKELGTSHKFILCTNNENEICEKICYERLKRVINGYTNRKKQYILGVGGNLIYWQIEENIDMIVHPKLGQE